MKNIALLLVVFIFIHHYSFSQCNDTEVAIVTSTGQYGNEMGWTIIDQDGIEMGSFNGGDDFGEYTLDLCLPDGCYILEATDSYGNGWNGGSIHVSYSGEEISYSLESGGYGNLAFGINTGNCLTAIELILAEHSITLLVDSGPKDNRINWAFQNRNMPNPNDEFTSEEEFVTLLQEDIVAAFTVGDPLEKEPFARYRNFFNLYAWWWPDPQLSEDDFDWGLFKSLRDAYFLPWADDEHGWATLFSISRYGGGGGAGTQPDTRTGDGKMYGTGWETLLHEFSHTMPQIPDEYSASGEWSGGSCWEGPNTSGNTVRDMIPWRNWIEPGTPLPTPYVEENLDVIGAYEGALTNYFGCHRPTARNCIMGAGGFGEGYGQGLCAPCRQRVVCLLYKYVDVIENPQPANPNFEIDGEEVITFSADFVKPEPNTQVNKWFLNGELVATDVESLELTFGLCDVYELTLMVEDTTDWVRYDAEFDHIYPKPVETHTWIIDQVQTEASDLTAAVTIENIDCSGEPNGIVTFEPSGGTAPYTAYWQGELVGLAHTELSDGDYAYWVKDDAGCAVEVSATVQADPLLEVQICSEFESGWTLFAEVSGYSTDDLEFLWSNGESTQQISGLSDGSYVLEVTTPEACTITQTVLLDQPDESLSVSHEYFNSADTEPTGSIYLTVAGGIPTYSVQWFKKVFEDLTSDSPEQVESSGSDFGHIPEQAFDNDLDTKWLQMGTGDVWLRFNFSLPQVIEQYAVTSGDDVEGRDPKDWMFQGSNNGTDWVTLDERNNEDFAERKLRRLFTFDNQTAYNYYRFYIVENSGEDAVQVQELEFLGADAEDGFVHLPQFDDQFSILNLETGTYAYLVDDQNHSCAGDTLQLTLHEAFEVTGMSVVQYDACTVTIEDPNPDYNYVWLSDEAGSEILHEGLVFSPPAGGNYWVAAFDPVTGGISNNRPGFAVSMPNQPAVDETEPGLLGVIEPDSDFVYHWYTDECGGEPIHQGTTYMPGSESGTYWVSAWWAEPFPDPIDPTNVPGLVKRMDAADLNGDGLMDDPGPETSSLYGWDFTPEGSWNDGSWFAFRGNHQNGLGVVDFATMWLQCFQPAFQGYRAVVLAYKENALSWEGSAPFFGLDNAMPYSGNPTEQLYSDDVPASTLSAETWLNGAVVDPMATANPMAFCVLGQNFDNGLGWTDCTDTHWEGELGEALFYADPLTDAQMIGVTEYLRQKWITAADLESKRVPIDWAGIVGLNESAVAFDAIIAPNPGGDNAVLRVELPSDQTIHLRLYTSDGRLIAQTQTNGQRTHFALSSWSQLLENGMYLVEVSTERTGKQVLRWVKH